jgi:hypothetical protein
MRHPSKLTVAVGILVAGLALASCADTATAAKPTAAKSVTAKPTQRTRAEFPGFTHVVRQGTDYFCQVRSPTGSRARTGEQCFRRDEMEAMEANNRDFFKDAGGGSSHDSLRTDSPR